MPKISGQPKKVQNESSARRPFPQFNAFRPFVMDELIRRKRDYPLALSAPFVRLTSATLDPVENLAFFTLGLHGFGASDLNIFDPVYGGNREIVGYAYDLAHPTNGLLPKVLVDTGQIHVGEAPIEKDSTPGPSKENLANFRAEQQMKGFEQDAKVIQALNAHPVPGITGATVTRRGIGAPMVTKVQWTCYNRSQLEFLRNHFMIPGRYVVFEWGAQFNNKTITKPLNFSNYTQASTDLADCLDNGRGWIIKNWVEPNQGNYDFVVGVVGNFGVEMDAQTGMFECWTTIYSMGEMMWGIDLHKTVVVTHPPDALNKVVAFNDYFAVDGLFSNLIAINLDRGEYVANVHESWTQGHENRASDEQQLRDFKNNPDNKQFISWNFFTNVVLKNMFEGLPNEGIKLDLEKFLNFHMTLDPNSTDPEAEDWVGDNQYLRSTNARVMLLVKHGMDVPAEFLGAGYFDDFPGNNKCRGKLSKGVWLNVSMIRRAFLAAASFDQAMTTILNSLNSATAGYWGLRLFYDEETNQYKVVDFKATTCHPDQLPAFYRFNNGTEGELIHCDIDSAFPPELVTQLALFTSFQGMSRPDKDALMMRYGKTLGTTSRFIFSLNWTNLRDVVETEMTARRLKKYGDPTTLQDMIRPPTESSQKGFNLFRFQDNATESSRPLTVGSQLPTPTSEQVLNGWDGGPEKKIHGTDLRVEFPRGTSNVGTSHNNPGALIYAGQKGATKGAPQPGSTAHWAKFETPEEGFEALVRQVQLDQGRGHTLDSYIEKYDSLSSPTVRDNYRAHIKRLTGLENETMISSVDPIVLANAQARWETGARIVGSSVPRPPVAEDPTTPTQATTPEEAERKKIEKRTNNILARFGDPILAMVAVSPSIMINYITKDGYEKYPNPNAFVAPFPTTTAITVELLGLSGFSVSDGFFVHKLPFVFEQFGCFQITEINESITTRGWVTRINGYFKLLSLDGAPLTKESIR